VNHASTRGTTYDNPTTNGPWINSPPPPTARRSWASRTPTLVSWARFLFISACLDNMPVPK
jgi:hypothetical protein